MSSSCKISCTGLFADVQYVENEDWQVKKMEKIIKEYRKYQAQFGKDLVFDPEEQSLGIVVLFNVEHPAILSSFVSEAVKETRMQFIQIHFSPATFDELELDVRVTIGWIIAYVKTSIELILNCSFCYYGYQWNCGGIRWVFSAEW